MVVASQLIAEVKVTGDTEAKSRLKSMSDTVDKTGGSFKSMHHDGISSTESFGSHIVSAFTKPIGAIFDFGSKLGMGIFGLEQLGQAGVSFAESLLATDAAMEQTTVAFNQLLGGAAAAHTELDKL